MSDSSRLEVEESDGLLRITIPFGSSQKRWMMLAATVMVFFGAIMCAIATYAIRSATKIHALWIIPEVVFGLIICLYVLGLAAIRATPGKIIEFDGRNLFLGISGSEKKRSWPREQITSFRVSRLPMVPVANLEMDIKGGGTVQAGVYRRSDLEAVAQRLRVAIGLGSKDAK
jgi:hypothetical protein